MGIVKENGLLLEVWDQAEGAWERNGWAQWKLGMSQGFGAIGRMDGSRKCCSGQGRIGKAQWEWWSQWELSLGNVLPVEDLKVTSQLLLKESTDPASTHDTSHRNGPTRDVLTPETQDQCESSDFEGDQKRFVNEEVPACHKADGVVDEVAS